MKKNLRFFSLACAGSILVLVAMPVPVVDARKAPQGDYLGDPSLKDGSGATGLKLREMGRTLKHPDSAIKIHIPNPGGTTNQAAFARGRFSGQFQMAGNSLGFVFNPTINGRLRKSQIRQGGTKFLISGKWTWTLDRNRLDKPAKGKFKLKIKRQIENGALTWVMSGPIRIGHNGSDPEHNYVYSGRFKAINRPPVTFVPTP